MSARTSRYCRWSTARDVLGSGVMLPSEVDRVFSGAFSNEELTFLSRIPFGVDQLRIYAPQFSLIPVSALPVDRILSHLRVALLDHSFRDSASLITGIAPPPRARWILVRRQPRPASKALNVWEQAQLVGGRKRLPLATEVLLLLCYHFTLRGERLLSTEFTRTTDVGRSGSTLEIGSFDELGIKAVERYGGYRLPHVGVLEVLE